MKEKTMKALLNGQYEAIFKLQYKKDENNQTYGVLTVPYVEWADSKNSFLSHRVLNIKGGELECIEKQYFDNFVTDIPVQGYPSPVEMCDFLYKVIPPNIYNQILSNTFKIKKNADPYLYGRLISKESSNITSKKDFLKLKNKYGINLNPDSILYAKKISESCSRNPPYSVLLNKSDSFYKFQIYDFDNKSCFQLNIKDLYAVKRLFDSINTSFNFQTFKKYRSPENISFEKIKNTKKTSNSNLKI